MNNIKCFSIYCLLVCIHSAYASYCGPQSSFRDVQRILHLESSPSFSLLESQTIKTAMAGVPEKNRRYLQETLATLNQKYYEHRRNDYGSKAAEQFKNEITSFLAACEER